MTTVVAVEVVIAAVASLATAAWLCRGSKLAPLVRSPMRWLALAALAWGAGLIAERAITGALDGTAVPVSFGDLASLIAVPVLVAGLITMAAAGRPGPAGVGTTAGTLPPIKAADALARLADGYVLAAGLFVVGWVTLFGSAYHRSGDAAGGFTLVLIHPLVDLAALGVTLPFVVAAGRRGLAPYLALGAMTLSDSLAVGARATAADPGIAVQLTALAGFCLLACTPLVAAGRVRLLDGSPMRGVTAMARRDPPRSGAALVTLTATVAAALAALAVIGEALAGELTPAPVLALAGGTALLALAVRVAGLLVRDRAAAAGRQEAGRQFRELADRIADVVLVCGLDGTIRWASPASTRYGYAAGDLTGASLAQLVHPEDLVASTRAVQSAVRRGQPSGRFSCRVRSADGTWRHAEALVSRYHDPGSPDQLLVTARDVSDQVALRRQVTHLTFHDALTGLPNRAYLEDRARDMFAAGPRGTAGAIFLDLDGFTGVNDSVGHGAGDLLLTQAARRLRAAVPSEVTVARWGGDEFALLVEDAASAGEIVDVAERLTLAVAEAPFTVADRDVPLTASVGVAFANGGGHGDLLRNADVAMSRAKDAGGGRVEVFAAHMHADVVRRVELASDLRRAITEQELELEYQPVVDLASGRVLGAEALVRWRRAGEPVPPAEFLGVAEDSGLVVELGDWVLRQACRQAAAWRDAGLQIGVSVNFSRRQLSAARFTESVTAALDEAGLDPGALTLEIAERVLIEGAAPMVAGLAALRRRGLRLAIDDFGTGYASLVYLRQLPVDIIKIDPSFVAGLDHDPTLGMLVRTIVRVGRELGIEVVAEGIERAEQLDALRDMGCDLGQGFLIARPMAAREIETLPGTEPSLPYAGGPIEPLDPPAGPAVPPPAPAAPVGPPPLVP
jgi:diguanylate cyclase (GGDEF)-like protein/PAS domain S-box-containing protein